MASKAKSQPKKAPNKKNGYESPKPLVKGAVLMDNQKNAWKVGESIGRGGFGEIYSACKVGTNITELTDYPYVIKIVSKTFDSL
jgi:vaccinia related kinase